MKENRDKQNIEKENGEQRYITEEIRKIKQSEKERDLKENLDRD